MKYTTDCTATAKSSGASGNAEEKYASAPCHVVTKEMICKSSEISAAAIISAFSLNIASPRRSESRDLCICRHRRLFFGYFSRSRQREGHAHLEHIAVNVNIERTAAGYRKALRDGQSKSASLGGARFVAS